MKFQSIYFNTTTNSKNMRSLCILLAILTVCVVYKELNDFTNKDKLKLTTLNPTDILRAFVQYHCRQFFARRQFCLMNLRTFGRIFMKTTCFCSNTAVG